MSRLDTTRPAQLSSTSLPRALQVLEFAQARADEIKQLTAEMANSSGGNRRAFQTLPRHERRRAMSHNIHKIPARLRAQAQREMDNVEGKEVNKKPSRRKRRRPRNMLEVHARRQRKHKWLATHIWHAKRFKMIDLWGFRLPLHPSDKSVRATYKASRHLCTVYDNSYTQCIELRGARTSILTLLKPMCHPFEVLQDARYLSGAEEGEVLLYERDKYPTGAIAPVQFFWLPCQSVKNSSSGEGADSAEGNCAAERSLWLWVHAAVFDQVFHGLQEAVHAPPPTPASSQPFPASADIEVGAASAAHRAGVPAPLRPVTVVSLARDFARFELRGAKTNEVLSELLRDPTTPSVQLEASTGEASPLLPSTLLPRLRTSLVNDELPAFCVISARVRDFRTFSTKQPFHKPQRATASSTDRRVVAGASPNSAPAAAHSVPVCAAAHSVPVCAAAAAAASAARALRTEHAAVPCAANQLFSAAGRQAQTRLAAQHVQPRSLSLPTADAREGPAKRRRLSQRMESEEKAISGGGEDNVSYVDVLLVHCPPALLPRDGMLESNAAVNDPAATPPPTRSLLDGDEKDSKSKHKLRMLGGGWDIIVSEAHAHPLWNRVVQAGGRAIGLRDRRRFLAEQHKLSFPQDFPDTTAGRMFELYTSSELRQTFYKKPPAKRMNYGRIGVPHPFEPHWDELLDLPPSSCTMCASVTMSESKWRTAATAQDKAAASVSVPVGTHDNGVSGLEVDVDGRSVAIGITEATSLRLPFHVLREPALLELLRQKRPLPTEASAALVPVAISLARGVVNEVAMIFLASAEDRLAPANSFSMEEPLHRDAKACKDFIVVAKGQLLLKESKKEPPSNSAPASVSEPHSPLSLARRLIGYVTQGGFSFTNGRGHAIGFVLADHVAAVLQAGGVVLVRDVNSRTYRPAILSCL